MRIDSKNILKSNCTENSFGKKWKKTVKKKKKFPFEDKFSKKYV